MLQEKQVEDIIGLIEDEKARLGSYRSVAKKCGVSEATISQLRSKNYAAAGDDMYKEVAIRLGYDFDNDEWHFADITNSRIVYEVLSDAKNESMFIGIANPAGSSKTATANVFIDNNKRKGAFKITCKEFSAKEFLSEMLREIGGETPKGYARANDLINAISEAIKKIAHLKPILIIDQANSLKPAAVRTLLHIDNQTEDILGLVAMGTDALEAEIKKGVRLNRTGYDEIDSRFGRKYVHLIGATLADTRRICEANGIKDNETQVTIFNDCSPVYTTLEDGKSIKVVQDIRVIKRKIKGRLLQQKSNINN